MGCAGDVQTVKDQMMILKLQRMEVQMAKEKEIKKLSEIDGRPIKSGNIPDYIDPEFAKEKNIVTDYVDIDNIYDDDYVSEDNKKANKKKDKNKKEKNDKKKNEKSKKDKKKDKDKDKDKDKKNKKKK